MLFVKNKNYNSKKNYVENPTLFSVNPLPPHRFGAFHFHPTLDFYKTDLYTEQTFLQTILSANIS